MRCHYSLTGTDKEEDATPLYSCLGVFIDRFIFRSNFPGMRLPWKEYQNSTYWKSNSLANTYLTKLYKWRTKISF